MGQLETSFGRRVWPKLKQCSYVAVAKYLEHMGMFQNMDPQLSSLKTNGLDHSWPPLFGDIYICFVGLSRDHMDQLKSIFLIRVNPFF